MRFSTPYISRGTLIPRPWRVLAARAVVNMQPSIVVAQVSNPAVSHHVAQNVLACEFERRPAAVSGGQGPKFHAVGRVTPVRATRPSCAKLFAPFLHRFCTTFHPFPKT